MNAIKEEEKKQLEQEDDYLIYTYARENERKVRVPLISRPATNLFLSYLDLDHGRWSDIRGEFWRLFFTSLMPSLSQVWSGILMKCSTEGNNEFYHDEVLDFGYESEIMIIDPEEYVRFPLPKGTER